MMSGLLIGSVIGGLSGDYFGRKKSLYAATFGIGISTGTAKICRAMIFTEISCNFWKTSKPVQSVPQKIIDIKS